jgi:hypothetical protein
MKEFTLRISNDSASISEKVVSLLSTLDIQNIFISPGGRPPCLPEITSSKFNFKTQTFGFDHFHNNTSAMANVREMHLECNENNLG